MVVATGAPPNEGQTTLFDGVSYALATQLLQRAYQVQRCVRKFVEHDHWQNGDGWVGPRPAPSDDGYAQVMEEIRRAFVSYNAVGEILERHMTCVIGQQPTWDYTVRRPLNKNTGGEELTDAEQQLVDEIGAAIQTWWTDRRVHQVLQEFTKDMLWAKRSTLRLFIPQGYVSTTVDEATGESYLTASADTIEDALAMLFVEHPCPEDSTVFVDPATQRWLGITRYATVNSMFTTVGMPVMELSFLDEDGMTVVKRMDTQRGEGYPFDLGGRLTMWESRRVSPLITQQVIEAQRALNLALSMLPRNVVTGGFLERVLLNAQLPGEWILNDKGERVGFKPAAYKTGAGTTNFVQGTEYKDESGNTKLSTPDIRWRPPSDTAPTQAAADYHYTTILREGKQGHVLAAAQAGDSGWSKEQARADFKTSLELTAPEVDSAGRWLLETVVAWAEQIMGVPGYYTETLKSQFQCRVTTGPLSVDERQQASAEVDKNLISIETAMEQLGIDDVAAEMARIASQPNAKQNLITWQATTLDLLIAAGFPLDVAAETVGMDKAIVQKLTTYMAENPPQPETQPGAEVPA